MGRVTEILTEALALLADIVERGGDPAAIVADARRVIEAVKGGRVDLLEPGEVLAELGNLRDQLALDRAAADRELDEKFDHGE